MLVGVRPKLGKLGFYFEAALCTSRKGVSGVCSMTKRHLDDRPPMDDLSDHRCENLFRVSVWLHKGADSFGQVM